MFDYCGLLSVVDDPATGSRRRVEAFLDKKRLQPGRPFARDFVTALTSTKVAVPIVSRGSLQPMTHLTANSDCDNVFLEWSIMVELQYQHQQETTGNPIPHQHLHTSSPSTHTTRSAPSTHPGLLVAPLLLGDVVDTPGQAVAMTNVLTTRVDGGGTATLVQAMPRVVVKSVVAKARDLLESLGVTPSAALETRTVKDVVDAVTGSLGIPVHEVLAECQAAGSSLEDLAVSGIHRRCVNKVYRILEPAVVASAAVAGSRVVGSAVPGSNPPPPPASVTVIILFPFLPHWCLVCWRSRTG